MTRVICFQLNTADQQIPISSLGTLFPNSLCALFTVYGTITFESGKTPQRLFLCTEACQSQTFLHDDIKRPILREIMLHTPQSDSTQSFSIVENYQQMVWLDMKRNFILRDLRVYLNDEKGEIPSVVECKLNGTLLTFRQNRKN